MGLKVDTPKEAIRMGFVGLGYSDIRKGTNTVVEDFTLLSDPLFIDSRQKHHTFICAKSGYGKSYLAGVIAEEAIQAIKYTPKKTACIFFDRMGIFGTLDTPNEDQVTVNRWNSKVPIESYQVHPKGFKIQIWVPAYLVGNYDSSMYNGVFSVKPSQFSPYILSTVFNMKSEDQQVNLYRKALNELTQNLHEFSLTQLTDHIQEHAEEWHFKPQTRDALFSKLEALVELKILNKDGIEVHQLISDKQITVIDLSMCDVPMARLIVNLITNEIVRERSRINFQITMAKKRKIKVYIRNPVPPVHIIIDEAHNFLPNNVIFEKGIREGRNIGVKFTCISQSPDLTEELFGAITHLFIGMINIDKHIAYLKTILPMNPSLQSLKEEVKGLEKGCFLYYNLEQKTKKRVRIRPRMTLHTATTEIDDETQYMLNEETQHEQTRMIIQSNPDEIYDPVSDPQPDIEAPTPLTEREKKILEWNENYPIEEVKSNELSLAPTQAPTPVSTPTPTQAPTPVSTPTPTLKEYPVLPFKIYYSKLRESAFSTIRGSDNFAENDILQVIVSGHGKLGLVRIILKFQKFISELATEFLCHDTDTKTREEAIAVLKEFADIDKLLTVYRCEWIPIDVSIYLTIYGQKKQNGQLSPNVRYEIITRTAEHILSPSHALKDRFKAENMPFEQYKPLFLEEMAKSPEAQKILSELANFVFNKGQKLALICYEKDPERCHRTIVRDLIIQKWQQQLGKVS